MDLQTRRKQIWRGERISPEQAARYRTQWVQVLANQLQISFREALQKLSNDYGPSPVPVDLPSPSGPSLPRKLVNYTQAELQHTLKGRPLAAPEVQHERLTICRSNECGYYQTDTETCLHTSCGCPVVRKTSWADQKCPVGRW